MLSPDFLATAGNGAQLAADFLSSHPELGKKVLDVVDKIVDKGWRLGLGIALTFSPLGGVPVPTRANGLSIGSETAIIGGTMAACVDNDVSCRNRVQAEIAACPEGSLGDNCRENASNRYNNCGHN